MKILNSRLSISNATHEVRVRLNSTTHELWTDLKSNLESSTGRIYSDSAFMHWAIKELSEVNKQ